MQSIRSSLELLELALLLALDLPFDLLELLNALLAWLDSLLVFDSLLSWLKSED